MVQKFNLADQTNHKLAQDLKNMETIYTKSQQDIEASRSQAL
jgi:hypothetical protein